MLYADDLGLTTNDPGELQTMLNKLRTYAEKKGLTVNTAKSEVVHFNSKSVSPLQNPFTYDGVVLPEKDRFKYLGMLLDRRMNPKIAEEHAVRPYMAAQSRVSEFAKSHDLKSRPHPCNPCNPTCDLMPMILKISSMFFSTGGRCMSTSAWCPLENAFVCLRAHARKYSGAAKTHTAEQHGSPQRGSRVAVSATTRARL